MRLRKIHWHRTATFPDRMDCRAWLTSNRMTVEAGNGAVWTVITKGE